MQELGPWLRDGLSAALVLLGAADSEGSSTDTNAACALDAGNVLARLGATALSEGWQLGLSWQLVSGDEVCGLLPRYEPGAAEPVVKAQLAQPARRPSSRLARQAAAEPSKAAAQPPLVVHAATAGELTQLLSALRQQQLAAAAAGVPAPALLARLELHRSENEPGALLHVLQLASPQQGGSCNAGGSSSGTSKNSPCVRQQAAADSQREALLRLLAEVADMHQRRREGEAAVPVCLALACCV